MSEAPRTKPTAARKPAAKSTEKTDSLPEVTVDAPVEVETATADVVESSDDAVAGAADSAAETVTEAANAAAAEAVIEAEAAAVDAETAATQVQDAAGPVRTIYVTAPQPPAKKGNRVLGVLIALLAAGVFAVLHTAAFAIITTLQGNSAAPLIPTFLQSGSLIWPVVIVFVVTALWAQLVNRAGWWSWVLGSFVVAAAVYAGSVLIFQLAYQTPTEWTDPLVIVSAILAREVVVWLGGILSARGKRLKVRNTEALAQFNREEAERRANREYAD